MGPLKSLSNLFAEIVRDCGLACHTDPSGDIRKGIARIEEEGIGFLALTLPVLSEALERGLESGQLDLTGATGFTRSAGLPLFLKGFLRQIFDESGRLLDKPCPEAVRCIRQICLMWKKIQLPCADKRIRAAFDTYVQTDKEIPDESIVAKSFSTLVERFDFAAGVLWTEVLGDASNIASSRTSIPKHGPGATAERIRANSKYRIRTWHERLDPYFPFDAFGVVNPIWALEDEVLSNVSFLSPRDEPPVRVVTVPKTLKGPRIIAIEPVCMQYTQQALMEVIVTALESHQLTRGKIGFSDQTVNQSLSLESSKSGRLATLDLKEASDRVPLWVVERMLRTVPDILGALLACRSLTADVPGHGIIHLRKFASMGSATCFPVEAMVFFTIIVAGRLSALSRRPRVSDVKRIASETYVYGDDILVPVDQVDLVISSLEAFGLKVNSQKSFWTGKFRESCGMDAFDGERVTPVYVRRMLPLTRTDAAGVLSWVSLRNQLYHAGYWGSAAYVQREVEKLLGPLPMVTPEAGCLGWNSFKRTVSVQGWDRDLHKFLVKSYTIRSSWRDDQLDGHAALMKCLLRLERSSASARAGLTSGLPDTGGEDSGHLQRTVRSVALSTKRRWAPPY